MRTDRLAPHCAYPHAARTPFFGWPHARRAGRSPQTKSGRLCAVQMAPVAVQPTVASTPSSSASIPSGSTVISRRRLLPDSSRRARITSRLVTAMTLTTSSPKAHSPVNAAIGGAGSGCALVHGPVERTLHRAPTVNDPRLVCSMRPCRCLGLSRWFCGFEWRSGTQCGQPVSRPLGQRLLPRIRCDSHVRRCEAHSRYCCRWSADFQMAVLLALDRNGFGLCRERYRARALSGSRRGSLPQGPIPSAFKGYGSARRGVNAILCGCARSTRRAPAKAPR